MFRILFFLSKKSQVLFIQMYLSSLTNVLYLYAYIYFFFTFSSWPFSLTDSIQPVALRVTRPLIALVMSFELN